MAATETGSKAARALDELYRAHVGEIYRYTYAVLGNRADAEDVTQTTFVNALRALERGERPRNSSHWLIAIAHNIVRQRFRQQQARPAEVELEGDIAGAEREDHGDPSLDEVVRGLQRIPASQREALVLREFEGRSYKEIQGILGLSPGAVETLLFRARRSLADELTNLVTCEQAELAMSKRIDGRLSRKERRRLDDHLRGCPTCLRLETSHAKQRKALKGLALVPLPFSLMFFKGAPSASAATGLSTIGAGGAAVASGVSAGALGGGGVATGVGVKVAAILATVSVAGGVGYEGVKEVQHHAKPKPPAKVHSAQTQARGSSTTGGAAAHGKGRTKGPERLGQATARLHQATRHTRPATTRGRSNTPKAISADSRAPVRASPASTRQNKQPSRIPSTNLVERAPAQARIHAPKPQSPNPR
ncbi:MAG: sigma-70 family RNA polymerase sigma factor [Gaiellaceae bacterium]